MTAGDKRPDIGKRPDMKPDRKLDQPPDPMAEMAKLFPGLAWGQAMVEGASRAQANLAADTMRQLNAPLVEGLARQKELLTALQQASKNLATLAAQMELATRQYADLTERTQAALEPYLRFVDWLAEIGAGGATKPR